MHRASRALPAELAESGGYRFRIGGEAIGRNLDDGPIDTVNVAVAVAGVRRGPREPVPQLDHEPTGVVRRPLPQNVGGNQAGFLILRRKQVGVRMSARSSRSLIVRRLCFLPTKVQISSHSTCPRVRPCNFDSKRAAQCWPAHSSCRRTLGILVPISRQTERMEFPSTSIRRIVFRLSMLMRLATAILFVVLRPAWRRIQVSARNSGHRPVFLSPRWLLQQPPGFSIGIHSQRGYIVATSWPQSIVLTLWPHLAYNVAMASKKQKAADSRENVLRIRLTDVERQELDAAAQERSLETSTWARSELLMLARAASGERGNRTQRRAAAP